MKIFKLPDLGEGLTEAVIHEWVIKEGDTVKVDQVMVTMETAKAVVEVPAPRAGTIAKLYGKDGDVILTGAPLVEFTDGDEETKPRADTGTVAGKIVEGQEVWTENARGITPTKHVAVKAMPAVRALAKKLGVDLTKVTGSGPGGQITALDVEKSAKTIEDAVPLKGARKAMAQAMIDSHAHVVAVTLCDDADITNWSKDVDITARVVRAVVVACKAVPALNAWYDSLPMAVKVFDEVHIGLALDTSDGLFVPVIRNAEKMQPADVRATINRFKTEVKARTIAPDELKNATISISNFGMFAGLYATPIVVPPMVSIIGVGQLKTRPKVQDDKIIVSRVMPLSLTFDHRAVTGGEAARFLAALLTDLSLKD